ncbi:MAG: hypothetical protein V4615_13615 [Bacteroidota bacterium]
MPNKSENVFGKLVVEFVWVVVVFVVVINIAFFKKPLNLYAYTLSIKLLLSITVILLFLKALWRQNKLH